MSRGLRKGGVWRGEVVFLGTLNHPFELLFSFRASGDENLFGSKVYDWNFVLPAGKVVDNGVGQVADAIAELTHRICWGDFRD